MAEQRATALDELERVDRSILDRLDEFSETRPEVASSEDTYERRSRIVERRALHGTAGKNIVEQLAVREAAVRIIADALDTVPATAELADRLRQGDHERRERLARIEEMARGVGAMNLDRGQDFDRAVEAMAEHLRTRVPLELSEIIPAIRDRLGELDDGEAVLPDAHVVTTHAPIRLPGEPRSWERIRPLLRLKMIYDHLRGFPAGGTVPLADVEQPLDPHTGGRRG